MEPPLSSLTVLVLGLIFTVYAFLVVESQSPQQGNTSPPPPPPPPPLSSPPPRPSLRPPLPSSPSPRSNAPPPSRRSREAPNGTHRGKGRKRPPPPPPSLPPKNKLNTGKKIGLLFAGIAAILQVGVLGFLVFKRRQLLKFKERYETCSN